MKNAAREGMVLQPRDLLILHGLFESRVMTLGHVASLYFEGRYDAAKKRVARLKGGGFLKERVRRAYEPSILYLTKKSFLALSQVGQLAQYPALGWERLEKRAQVSDLTIRHELAVMEVKVALLSALNRGGAQIVECTTWPLLSQFEANIDHFGSKRTLKPDGFLRFQERVDEEVSEYTFFLEVDRGSETLDTLRKKVICYREYYTSGRFATKMGGCGALKEDFPFRVLMVMQTPEAFERRNNTLEELLAGYPPILTQVMLTTFNELLTDPLGRIWITPQAFREAVRGTPFERTPQSPNGYRPSRWPERTAFVEAHAQKDGLT